MNFNLTEEQQAVADLAAQIFSDQLDSERFKAVEAVPGRFDRSLWDELAKAGLLGISLPSEHGGSGQEFLATAVLLEQAGKYAAPIPLLATLAMGALPVAEFGTRDQQAAILPTVIGGDHVMTAALVELGTPPSAPGTTARPDNGSWRLDGTKTCVPQGAIADRILVPATMGPGRVGVFILDPSAPGVTVTELRTTTGDADAHLDLASVIVPANALLGGADGADDGRADGVAIVDWITARTTSAMCSVLAGACKQAVALTAEYAKTREQFDRPIATFQAVSQRTADAYIDAEAVQLTSRQAAWRLSEGLPASDEIAIAKFFAADAGQRVVHAAQHIHGGTGVDRDYPLHRYFLLAKQLELSLGGATAQLLKIGARLASEPAAV